jgi:F-box protein 11
VRSLVGLTSSFMSYCLNPICQQPQNQAEIKFCTSCGAKLLLGDRYRAIKPIGQGGFGRTFLAVDEYKPSKPRCVIKQFFPQAQGTNNIQKAAELFAQEALRLDELGKHPQIPELLGYFNQDDRQYLVQEFIDGKNLAQELSEAGRFNETHIRELLNDLLPVLEFVHSQQVIHRDIKPENIIRRHDGQMVLVDFGAAKFATGTALLKTGTSIGSPEYVAPEQTRGKAVFASDLYGLGVTAIHLLTQVSPFDLFDINEDAWVWRDYLSDNPVNDGLGRILDKLIANGISRRYRSATKAIEDLHSETSFSLLPISTINSPQAPTQPTSTPTGAIIVAKVGTADYQTIEEAIQNAPPESYIAVRPGLYREGLVIDKPLEILGDGQPNDIIIESADSSCILMQTDYAVVRGLTLRGCAGRQGKQFYGVDIPQGCLILEDCDITSDSLACIAIRGSTAKPTIRRCQIHAGKQNGVVVSEDGRGTLEDCDIFANTLAGVAISQGGNPAIYRCQIHAGKQNGVVVSENGRGTVEDCNIFANASAGVAIRQRGNPTIRHCQIHDGKDAGVLVRLKGQGTVEDCDIFANASAGVVINSDADNPTIRGCKIHDGKNAGVLATGKGIVEDCDIFGNASAGVVIKHGGNPTIRHCQIHHGKQNGVWVTENGRGVVKDCNIFANAYPGVDIAREGNPVIQSCRITRHRYQAVYVHDKGKGTIENCDLRNNDGGAFKIGFWCSVQRRGNKT